MNYWYIWYEIYENGELIPNSRARYYQGYVHKSSAERRAKQMWSGDQYNPMRGTIFHYEWIVSQTNPWNE